MISSFLSLQSFGYFGGGAIGNLLNQWSQAGIFSYAIPFLLIFALTFGILTKINIFGKDGNRTINAIIALAVGLMALQFPIVPLFFEQIFPALGVGLAVLLTVLILTGLFIDPNNKGWMNGLAVISVIVVLIVVLSSTWTLGLGGFGSWWNIYGGNAIAVLVFLGLIAAIVGAGSKKNTNENKSPIARALMGN